jgi:hypothetical protein
MGNRFSNSLNHSINKIILFGPLIVQYFYLHPSELYGISINGIMQDLTVWLVYGTIISYYQLIRYGRNPRRGLRSHEILANALSASMEEGMFLCNHICRLTNPKIVLPLDLIISSYFGYLYVSASQAKT